MNFIQVKDKKFYYKDEEITLRGLGIGNWLCVEHFMVGLPGSEEIIRRGFAQAFDSETANQFFEKYQEQYIREEDFAYLKKCGVNFVRVPFNYRLFIDDNDFTFREEGFRIFDRLFALGEKYQIFIMPDLHTTPGAQNPDWHSDNSFGVPLFWKYRIFREQITKLWRKIAERYQNEPYLMGYDLLNEPAFANWKELNCFYQETIEAIREVDKHHIIILEGDQFSMDFSGLATFDDSQLALGFHYYPSVWQEDLIDLPRNQRIKEIDAGLQRLLSIRETFNLPVLCGEFGYGAPDVGRETIANELLEDTLQLFEKEELSWTLWCYKDAGYMSLLSPAKNADWLKLISAIGTNWSQDIEKQQAGKLIDTLKESGFSNLTQAEEYLLQFRLRAAMYELERNHLIVPELQKYSKNELFAMTEEFAFDRCEINIGMYECIKNFL
jgi:endoglucanase